MKAAATSNSVETAAATPATTAVGNAMIRASGASNLGGRTTVSRYSFGIHQCSHGARRRRSLLELDRANERMEVAAVAATICEMMTRLGWHL
jgi:hypothetical protein